MNEYLTKDNIEDARLSWLNDGASENNSFYAGALWHKQKMGMNFKKVSSDTTLCDKYLIVFTSDFVIPIKQNFDADVMINYITLDEIKNQTIAYLKSINSDSFTKFPLIHVLADSGLSGHLYTYGNYGDSWYCSGNTMGYA